MGNDRTAAPEDGGTQAPRDRYDRQLGIPGVGERGQARLQAGRVLVIGAGGLGFPVLTYLGAAGVGSITFVDDDRVEISNLNRQCLFGETDVGRHKVEAAAARLSALNSRVRWTPVCARLDDTLAARLVAGADIAVDCADNHAARLTLAAAARRAGVPLLHGAVAGFAGTLAVFDPSGPCLACMYPPPLPSDEPPAVLGATAGAVGAMMAAECVRMLCGIGPSRAGRALLLDLECGSFDWVTIERRPGCELCGAEKKDVVSGQ